MAERDPDPYVLYTVMRTSLGIRGGKIGAQCQHAFDYLTREVDRIVQGSAWSQEELARLEGFRAWRESKDHAKVVLGASDEQFEQVKEDYPLHFSVIDLGYTQVAPNTETCLCLWPMRKSARSTLLQKLRPL